MDFPAVCSPDDMRSGNVGGAFQEWQASFVEDNIVVQHHEPGQVRFGQEPRHDLVACGEDALPCGRACELAVVGAAGPELPQVPIDGRAASEDRELHFRIEH